MADKTKYKASERKKMGWEWGKTGDAEEEESDSKNITIQNENLVEKHHM